ncbi:MAG: peptidoglycan DD-metalloendopeptidase family protein [Gallionella sp.]|nr:peptidoglycan DD-metalloendopeptidase family protein [Gallionella sp.]MDD4947492.1 peptidoglycan DD-metalloendopeptidase family protein [Gallionella sp.]MDD5612254.1 peptidoglycan DD-metalloendopeptidase family protein [Gallionella sp.]
MLTQNMINQERKNKLRWFVTISTLPLLGVVTAFGLVPTNNLGLNNEPVSVEEITLPVSAPLKAANTTFWRTERLQPGDTIADLTQKLGIKDAAASDYLRNSADARSFRKLPNGKELQAETDATGALVSLRYLDDKGAQVIIKKQDDRFTTETIAAQLEKRLFVRTGEIKTSLYEATDAVGMPESAANQLTQIFNGDIDFHHDLKPGDKFTAVYEMTYSNGALVSTGKIQAAEFINQGHAYRAVLFSEDGKHSDYYTPEGKSLRKAFLRSPIAFSRVSSGFTMSRFHPVLNQWRAHKGVDFAAPIGTPVKATSDATVSFVGQQNGYGNVVMLKHQGNLSTVYGHLSRFAKGLRTGQRIAQGDVIAYVGMTGITSGPHLHYEFKVNGLQRDPLRVALPNALPVSDAHRAEFKSLTDNFIARLNQLRNTNLAKLD